MLPTKNLKKELDILNDKYLENQQSRDDLQKSIDDRTKHKRMLIQSLQVLIRDMNQCRKDMANIELKILGLEFQAVWENKEVDGLLIAETKGPWFMNQDLLEGYQKDYDDETDDLAKVNTELSEMCEQRSVLILASQSISRDKYELQDRINSFKKKIDLSEKTTSVKQASKVTTEEGLTLILEILYEIIQYKEFNVYENYIRYINKGGIWYEVLSNSTLKKQTEVKHRWLSALFNDNYKKNETSNNEL